MVVGLGTDIVEIARIERAIRRSRRFMERIFTDAEIEYCQSRGRPYQHFAGRFAAKEAVIKALGHAVTWREIEIINDERGKPQCVLHGSARAAAGARQLLVSISHCETFSTASAVAVAEATDARE